MRQFFVVNYYTCSAFTFPVSASYQFVNTPCSTKSELHNGFKPVSSGLVLYSTGQTNVEETFSMFFQNSSSLSYLCIVVIKTLLFLYCTSIK